MDADKTTIERLKALIVQGLAVEQTKYVARNIWPSATYVDYAAFHGWRSQSRVALISVLGDRHAYLAAFDGAVSTSYLSNLNAGVAILKSVLNDFEQGYFKTLRGLISAEIFDDFLEMAEHLLKNDFKDPAAMLIGATLEGGLKRIATERGLTVKGSDGLASVNGALQKADVYNKLTNRQVQVWTTIRNHADHGEFDQYSQDDVVRMLVDVRQFLNQYLS